VVLEVRAEHSGITHWLGVPDARADYALGQLRAAIPSVRVELADRAPVRLGTALEFRLSRGHVPLRVEDPSGVAASLLASLQPLGRDELAVIQWVFAPSLMRRPTASNVGGGSTSEALFGPRVSRKIGRDERAKLSEALFEAVGRIGVGGSASERRRIVQRRLLSALYARRSLESRLQPRLILSGIAKARTTSAKVPMAFPSLLNAAELGTLAAFPMDSPVLPGLVLGGARELPARVDVPERGLILGIGTYPGAERPIAISEADFARHLLALGPTGAGKSALFNSLAVQILNAGHGLLLVDPAGDLAARVIDSVPQERQHDVIVIDPADTEHPVGLNLLGVPNRSADLIVDDFVAVVKRAWGEHLVGPRSEDILRMACTTLCTQPDAALTDLPRLLVDKGFRRRILAEVDDPIALEPFWGWFDSLTIAKRADVVGPISNKLRSFYRPLLRNIIGQVASSFSMAEAMQDGKVIICSLARGAMGEGAASFFGAMVMALWAQAVQARVTVPPAERRPFYALVDEYQTLLGFSSPVDEILAQARKYKAGLAVATQSLSTLPAELKQASLINTRSKVVFQTGAGDAPLLAKEFAPHITAEDLRGLDAFHAYAVVSTGSMTSPPISIRTLPPPPVNGSGERVRELSRQRYGRPRADVEQAIRERFQAKPPVAPVGRKPR
jgi:energy-coupling factor transporter ATP-binding protein EcfA2